MHLNLDNFLLCLSDAKNLPKGPILEINMDITKTFTSMSYQSKFKIQLRNFLIIFQSTKRSNARGKDWTK